MLNAEVFVSEISSKFNLMPMFAPPRAPMGIVARFPMWIVARRDSGGQQSTLGTWQQSPLGPEGGANMAIRLNFELISDYDQLS